MFGIGMSEMLVILVIGLVVLGPKQLPEVARTLGKMFAQFKRTTNDLKEQVDREVRQFTEMEEVKEFKRSMEEELTSMKSGAEDFVSQQVAAGEEAAKQAQDAVHEAGSNGQTADLHSDGTDRPVPVPSVSGTAVSATADSVEYSAGKPAAATPGEAGLPPGKLPS
jgi:sec-independent protein translocase protein TatB